MTSLYRHHIDSHITCHIYLSFTHIFLIVIPSSSALQLELIVCSSQNDPWSPFKNCSIDTNLPYGLHTTITGSMISWTITIEINWFVTTHLIKLFQYLFCNILNFFRQLHTHTQTRLRWPNCVTLVAKIRNLKGDLWGISTRLCLFVSSEEYLIYQSTKLSSMQRYSIFSKPL